MIINNVIIVNHNKEFKGSIEFDNNRIKRVYHKQVKGVDGKGLYLIPSFFDTHTHGGKNFDFNDLTHDVEPKRATAYINYLIKNGVGAVIATTFTCSRNDLLRLSKSIKSFAEKYDIVKGWYIEGPYIAKEKKGAHNPQYICPWDMDLLHKVATFFDKNFAKIVTVAPEAYSNLKHIKALSKTYNVAVGHSNAQAEIAAAAFKQGANRVTHLYNGMSGFSNREPGVVNAVFNNKEIFVELITDNFTVSNTAALDTYHILSPYQLMIISDTIRCAGEKNGNKYSLGEFEVIKDEKGAYLTDHKTIAGSTLSFLQQAQNFAKTTKCSMQDFVKFTSYNAATSLKMNKQYGVIARNAKPNFLLVNKKFNIMKIYYKGLEVK